MAQRSLWKVLVPTLALGVAAVGYVGYRLTRLPASRPTWFLGTRAEEGEVAGHNLVEQREQAGLDPTLRC